MRSTLASRIGTLEGASHPWRFVVHAPQSRRRGRGSFARSDTSADTSQTRTVLRSGAAYATRRSIVTLNGPAVASAQLLDRSMVLVTNLPSRRDRPAR